MINCKLLKDQETSMWGYKIYTGSPRGNEEVKTLKECEYKFHTEEEAKKACESEFDKFNEKQIFN